MSYIFHSVRISVFDLHVALRPLLLPESQAVNNALRFLVNRESYQDYYKQNASTNSFIIAPLEKDAVMKNKFWQAFSRIHWHNNMPDFWKLQIPFLVKPKLAILCNDNELCLVKRGIRATIETEIYLTGMGWTTSIDIHLEGEIDPSYLIDLISCFKTGRSRLSDQDIYPFLLQDGSSSKLVRLNQIYASITNKLRSELYNVQRNSPDDKRVIERYHVISIRKYTGEPLLYRREKHDKPLAVMSASDRVLMQGLLYGRPVDDEEALKKALLYTQFDDANFALTEFDHGTLHFMQEILRKENLSPETLDCMGNNILIFLRMVFMLHHFYTSSKSQKNEKSSNLRGDVERTLIELPGRYTNKFCKGLYENYDGLSTLT